MPIRSVRLLLLLAALVAACGCNDTRQQRRLALDGVNSWGEMYNHGQCEAAYRQAAERFRRHVSLAEWTATCQELYRDLGAFKHFEFNHGNLWPAGGVGIVWVRGTAHFAEQSAELRADWELSGQQARLWNLELKFGGKSFSLPGFHR